MTRKFFSIMLVTFVASGCAGSRFAAMAIAPDIQETSLCPEAHEYDADAVLFVNRAVGIVRDVWIFDGQYNEEQLFQVYGSERVVNVKPVCSFRMGGAKSNRNGTGTDNAEAAIGGFNRYRPRTLLIRSNGRFGTINIEVRHVRLSGRVLGRSYRSGSRDALGNRVTKMVNHVFTFSGAGRGTLRSNRITIRLRG